MIFQELKKYSVTTVVRVCEATYDTSPVEKEGIQFLVSKIDFGLNCNFYLINQVQIGNADLECCTNCLADVALQTASCFVWLAVAIPS